MTDADFDALLAAQGRSYRTAGEGLRRAWPEEDALDREGLRALLADVHYGVLATSRPDGRAHATPVAFSLEGGAFWIGSVEGRRLANLRALPWASLVVFDGGRGEHRALTAEGVVALHEGPAFTAARARLDEAWVGRHGHPPDWASVLLELTPERVFSHGPPNA
ncbi:MAG TPA: pyridoxamine 5'-phosphate oxidase family protein [Gaiellaceae bacterium]|nr:pyridoxamine 5'-phosphate oxidase family protein [Gaiellaceae bacterium]